MPPSLNPDYQPARQVFSVSQLTSESRKVLEGAFPLIWVEGEISNLSRPGSGHWYFSLKDEAAQVRCAMFRPRNRLLNFAPENGMHILLRAKVSLYEPRGDFQILVEHMEQAGLGALQRAFEELKARLSEEGLFDTERKRPLPTLPRRIGVVTSPTGAALHDILTVLRRRFPAIPVLVYPVQVQGEGAARQIAAAIRLASQRQDCDVLIVGRGGGSLEDLWAFNEEAVARAIYDCQIPVVSAVGHEVDFTIADFVADQRAATPSAAAELVSPDRQDWLRILARQELRLTSRVRHHLQLKQQALSWQTRRLRRPDQRLQEQAQRLDELEQRLHNGRARLWSQWHHQQAMLGARLLRFNPQQQLQELKLRLAGLSKRQDIAVRHLIKNRGQHLERLAHTLDAISPLATLGRGYSIVTRLPERMLLRNAADIKTGDKVEARLRQGRLICQVEESLDD
ncbi:MAG: exodeoxyribonuclease VII large subunit [Gammaproteobacteria bacterium RBG_16_57_12]|nr:MAG: exodeoxyribonuclease VII large subunit [Gammaproteobacteria bacterium RBG_16_57_12]